jgi:hypothetical protein
MANSNQEIVTPMPFIMAVENLFNIKFKYDMAATEENRRCDNYFTESLLIDWPVDGWCWLNPPFRKLTKFVKKCKEQKDRDSKIVTIWPLSGDLNQIITWKEASVNIIHGRIWPEVRGCMLCKWEWGVYDEIGGLRWTGKKLIKIW